jgi:hypothetical protein
MTFLMIGGAVTPLFHAGYIIGYNSDSAWTGVGIGAIILFLLLHAFGAMAITQFRFEMLIVLPLSLVFGSSIGAINLYALGLPPLYGHLATFSRYWDEEVNGFKTVVLRGTVAPFATSIAVLIIFIGSLLISDPYDISQTRAVTTGVLVLFVGIGLLILSLVYSRPLDRKFAVYVFVMLVAPIFFVLLYKGGFGIILFTILIHVFLTCFLGVLDVALHNGGRTVSIATDTRSALRISTSNVTTARWGIGVLVPLLLAWIAFFVTHFFVKETSGGIILSAVTVATLLSVPLCFWFGKTYITVEKREPAEEQSRLEQGQQRREATVDSLSSASAHRSTTATVAGNSSLQKSESFIY